MLRGSSKRARSCDGSADGYASVLTRRVGRVHRSAYVTVDDTTMLENEFPVTTTPTFENLNDDRTLIDVDVKIDFVPNTTYAVSENTFSVYAPAAVSGSGVKIGSVPNTTSGVLENTFSVDAPTTVSGSLNEHTVIGVVGGISYMTGSSSQSIGNASGLLGQQTFMQFTGEEDTLIDVDVVEADDLHGYLSLSSDTQSCSTQEPKPRSTNPLTGIEQVANTFEPVMAENSSTSGFGQAWFQKNRKKVFDEYVDFGDREYECEHCHALFWLQERLKSSPMRRPKFGICCLGGKVCLPKSKPTPPYLEHLFNPANGPLNRAFKDNIRIYNSMFAFTSMGATVDTTVNNGFGPYVFKISGQIHHLMGSLLPPDNSEPKYAQLYVCDTREESRNRLRAMNQVGADAIVDESIVDGLIEMFDQTNELVKLFRVARDKLHENPLQTLSLRLLGQRTSDGREFDQPTCDDICGLIPGDIGEFRSERDIIIETHSKMLQRITKLHPKYMALQYPLLFPHGEDGFHPKLKWNANFFGPTPARKRVPMRAYYAYLIQDRQVEDLTLLKGGRLFQQFLVDAYATLEEDRLDFYRYNQKSLRSEAYKGIHEAVLRGDTDAGDVGSRIIMPSSCTGSVRYMISQYQDAMAICRANGNPDLFITFTCNVKWPEIVRELRKKKYQSADERADVISRLFKAKLDDMIAFIKSGKPFGKPVANVGAVEFQKRGLPHAHILIWLDSQYRCRNPEDIDSIVSAEIPDKDLDPIAYEAVSQFMIHGPCGYARPDSPCMKKTDKCSKNFPKKFKSETTIDSNGFVSYKRRDSLGSFMVKDHLRLDNSFVVPFNRELLIRYQAHINVEICSQSMMIKYLFKYISKGPDRARIQIGKKEVDEIEAYLNCRFICPYEAAWRLFQFPIHFREPAVERLPVHLPLQHTVVFDSTRRLDSVLGRPDIDKTMLTQWFEANRCDLFARNLTYSQFPSKFVWDTDSKSWTRRVGGRAAIGRIAYVHPASGELYYLRLLLNSAKGPMSFDEVKTINGSIYRDYQSACRALGLLGDDKEWNQAFEDTHPIATSSELRQLFMTIVMHCDVSDANAFLLAHWRFMSDDIDYRLQRAFAMPNFHLPEPDLRNYVLYELELLFTSVGSSLAQFKLPLPDHEKMEIIRNKLLREELNYDIDELMRQNSDLLAKLNGEQRQIYETVTDYVLRKKSGTFFVHGHGGTGKTFLWHVIISKIRSQGLIVLAVASSGIASLLLPGGRTAHSRFKIPLAVDECSMCHIKKGTQLAKLIMDASLIVWDEAPMNNKRCFEALDKSLRDILPANVLGGRNLPFGGKTLLLGGDFRQILPVVPGGTREDIVSASLSSSYLWPYFEVFRLRENMRLSNEGLSELARQELADFASWILKVGNGEICDVPIDNDHEASFVKIPPQLLIGECEKPVEAIVGSIYDGLPESPNNDEFFRERAIITPKNAAVSDINSYVLGLMPGQERVYLSSDSICSSSMDAENLDLLYPPDFLNQLEFSGMPTHALALKVGCPIMLLRNINQSLGLCNGTRLIVTQMTDRVIEAKIITGSHVSDKVFIPRITLTTTEGKWPFVFKRRQFPVRVCYAMTINKSQGQSLKKVGLFLPEPVFTHGQLYVALSRVTSVDGLRIYVNNNGEAPNQYAKNIVYKDVLSSVL